MLAVMALSLMCSCSKDDDGGSGGGGGTNTNPSVADIHVVVNEDGTVSGGHTFSAIDEKNFYVDYIKYTVEEGHLVVSSYDKAGFKGTANIIARLTYKGNTYDVLKIGTDASKEKSERGFYYCSNLISVNIPSTVTSIGDNAFAYCINLTSVTIPNSVTSIGNSAFNGCRGLTSIAIPNSMKTIGMYAFKECSLTTLFIPNSIEHIDKGAFVGCDKLTTIQVEDGNSRYDSRDNCNAIIETSTNTLIAGCNNSTFPNSITSIGESAFDECDGLTSIIIPNGVTSIGASAFHACANLASVSIPKSVISIGKYAFSDSYNLKSVYIADLAAWCNISFSDVSSNPIRVNQHLYINDEEVKDLVIPNGVTSIGRYAFYCCNSLTSLTIPNSVTSIGERAFYRCSGLTSIHCLSTTPIHILDDTFDDKDWWDTIYQDVKIYVPKGSFDAYYSIYGWRKIGQIIEE